MAVQFVHACQQTWNANCLVASGTNVRVPLIPVLDDPAECGRIVDEPIRGQCRQLNTYRAAFVHVETIPAVRADKELCEKVDQGPATKSCLTMLQGYIQNPRLFENRAPLRMEVDPIEQVLIVAPIAGMPMTRKALGSLDPFWETAAYLACYSTVQKIPLESACASVFWAGTEEAKSLWYVMGGDGYVKGAERNEVVDGNEILTWTFPRNIKPCG